MPLKRTANTAASAASAAATKPATRTTRSSASASKTPNPAPVTPTTKSNGKKRAAALSSVDQDQEAAPTRTTSAAAKKPRTKKNTTTTTTAAAAAAAAADSDQDAGDVNEREILASLSDVSADSSDEEDAQHDDQDDAANSSDEDDEDDRLAFSDTQPRSSLASMKLPNSKDDAVVKARLDKLRKSKSSSSSSNTPGVLYIGRLPKGFFENQLKAYFSQFGHVTRLRVSRNKKTGASKHYAFIEFEDKDVADIVQETMHNYLIDGRLLQVKQVSKDKIHPELWVGANRKFQKVPTDRIERVVRSRQKTQEQQQRTNDRALKRQQERRAKLQKLGIDYEFEGYTQHGESNTTSSAPNKVATAKNKTAKA
ncbi:related to NOP15 - protein involved in 60S ribosomal subunit biogenesis [Melanopsichium pennsylvanicum]|uniref:Related to NOP15 - protein involved in 60S ribosomal subunit biogenesis n=2 Tax=Melanopsichium pennsylvanicum TaxID=63383 RepID=A0AAJ4XNW5_9BASI|nr:related to NOP15-protein involved in 60S ribosomal subunit biogenesis [Melanopsichium pennsylvanicum 4]SNX85804.1 related to NOP15 - protein involved in 60S ribosomal subunit biogenesis [Melanopsichium pennsylvanicum]